MLLLELSVVFLCSLYCLLYSISNQGVSTGMLSLCSKQEVYSSEHYSEYFSFSRNTYACAYLASVALKTDFLSRFPDIFCTTPACVNCDLSPYL